jgi:hypothetical protein
MSMDYSEFTRLLGADPRSRDPQFLRARDSSPEFREAAAQAERFEKGLDRALALDMPPDLLERLRDIPQHNALASGRPGARKTWRAFALAASLLMAVGAAGLIWRMNSGWDSVEEYVVEHYHHDGPAMLARADGQSPEQVAAMLAKHGARLEPALAGIVSVIKQCPTPDGKGVHMVLNTDKGLVTVIYMPETPVTDGEQIAFDDSEAVLVQLPKGSAAIIGLQEQQVTGLHALVQSSIVVAAAKS